LGWRVVAMNQKGSGADARAASGHVKLRLLLTCAEAEWLERAVEVSGAWSRGLLIAEAMRAGLSNPPLKIQWHRRLRRIDTRVPRSLARSLKEFAAVHRVPQQLLLRRFLFRYLAAAPWRRELNPGLGAE